MGQAGCKNIEQGPHQFLLRTAFGLARLLFAGNVHYISIYIYIYIYCIVECFVALCNLMQCIVA